LFKTIGVIHVENKVKKNEKCEALHTGKIRGTPKTKGTSKIWLPSNSVPMQQSHMAVKMLSDNDQIFSIFNKPFTHVATKDN
jgi:hypothetical protein